MMSMDPAILWLGLVIILLIIEIATMGLTTIWFAGGAIAAFLLSLAGAGTNAQLSVFAVVSFVLLFFTRPWAMRHVNSHATKTNADSLIGRQARVTEEINNLSGTGSAVINGLEWTARSEKDDSVYPVDAVVEICAILGVKLIVKNVQEV